MSAVGPPNDIRYSPLEAEADLQAHAVWRRMRDEAPLYRNDEHDFWALSRYDDVLSAMVDTERFSSAHGTTLDLMSPDFELPVLIFTDPPEHTWHRRVVSRAFTVQAVARLESQVSRLCTELLDSIEGRHEFDFLGDYGSVIPPAMILALLGFPEGVARDFRDGVDATMTSSEDGAAKREALSSAIAEPGASIEHQGTDAELYAALPELLAARRSSPTDDLMSVLVNTELDEGGTRRFLTDGEIAGFVMMLSVAGTETVARLLGWAAALLDQHPDQRAQLAADPTRIENAVEECLRYEAPSPVNGRWVTRAVELHGQMIPAGSRLLLLNGSGNRDERHFPDADTFDVSRTIDRHLSFGYGAHYCVGAALARLEARIALAAMLERHPSWEVDYDRAEMVHTTSVRGYANLPVRV